MTKRGDRAFPPVPPHGWIVRFHNKAAALGWQDLCNVAPSATFTAWQTLTLRPTDPVNRSRLSPLQRAYAERIIDGTRLRQWQYEVTAGGRIWFCPDPDTRTVWLTYASPKHPKVTE